VIGLVSNFIWDALDNSLMSARNPAPGTPNFRSASAIYIAQFLFGTTERIGRTSQAE
jgi:hypothetical protein